ncbi:MAG TPA: alpha-1,2-fucosyltransferase [Candidatus Methylomirabilis sp.]|nr:alpha-1,2-fucosyltransferase [Candidatus Methylomirabilis sp.]
MIISKLTLGLGNQMFQYAFGRRTALNNQTELKLDISETDLADPKYHYVLEHLLQSGMRDADLAKEKTPLEISAFNVELNIATPEEIRRFQKYARKKGKINFLRNFLFADDYKYFVEKRSPEDPAYKKIGADAYLVGHWASEKYFLDIRDVLLKEFTPKNTDDYYQKTLAEINAVNAVSLHFRRGDYAINPDANRHHGVASLDYYYQAMKLIEGKTADPVYFVFSDDLAWVKNNLKTSRPVRYVQQTDLFNKSYQDLLLMSKCRHNIIANSTFSWWGAWLNQHPDKIICAPAKWFNIERDTRNLLPEAWLKI